MGCHIQIPTCDQIPLFQEYSLGLQKYLNEGTCTVFLLKYSSKIMASLDK